MPVSWPAGLRVSITRDMATILCHPGLKIIINTHAWTLCTRLKSLKVSFPKSLVMAQRHKQTVGPAPNLLEAALASLSGREDPALYFWTCSLKDGRMTRLYWWSFAC